MENQAIENKNLKNNTGEDKAARAAKKQAEAIKRENIAHFIFIQEMIAHGNRVQAYQEAYPDASESTARVNACRLLGKADIAARIHGGLMAIREVLVEQFREFYQDKLASEQEKREILAKIMRGQMEIEKEVVKGEGTVLLKQRPDMKDVLRAILMDNNMEKDWQNSYKLPDNHDLY